MSVSIRKFSRPMDTETEAQKLQIEATLTMRKYTHCKRTRKGQYATYFQVWKDDIEYIAKIRTLTNLSPHVTHQLKDRVCLLHLIHRRS